MRDDAVDLTSTVPTDRDTPRSPSVSASASPAPQQRKAPGLRIGTQPRKLVVKNLKLRPSDTGVGSQSYFDTTWTSLDAALTRIFDGTFTTDRMESLYRGVESLCRAKRAPEVHSKLVERMTQHVQSVRDEVKKVGRDPAKVVPVVEREWRRWSAKLNLIRSIFSFLNQSYLLGQKLPTLLDTGLTLFRTHILALGTPSSIGNLFFTGLCHLFLAERTDSNDPSNLQIMLASLAMIKALNIYSPFEQSFLTASSTFFSLCATEKMKTGSLASYIRACSELFISESALCTKFALAGTTKRRLWNEIEARFVVDPAAKQFILGDNRITGLLADADVDSLKGLYEMLAKVEPPAPYLKPAWETYISTTGRGIVGDIEHEDAMIWRLLRLKSQLDEIVVSAFRKDEILSFSLREGFASFVNMSRPGDSSADTVPRLLARYVDTLMKKGVKALTSLAGPNEEEDGVDQEVEKVLQQGVGGQDQALERQFEMCLDLFRFLAGKDVFEAFYKKDLAKRLLLSKSVSLDAERGMMGRLRSECGSAFTHNMETMFKDIELSKEMVRSFLQSKHGQPLSTSRIGLTVDVLSQSAWPTYPDTPCIVPEHIQKHLDAFAEYYTSNHSGRKIMWRHSVGHAVLTAQFDSGRKELVLSIFQAVVLLVFNAFPEGAQVTYLELRAATGLPDPDLKRSLQSLACAKKTTRVLRKLPHSRDVAETDRFCVNSAFASKQYRIKINQIQLKETVQEKEQTIERVKVDRQFEIQAAICRVMKARRRMRGEEIVLAVVDLCKGRGVLEVADVRAGIKKLEGKDYIEEVAEGGDEWVYVT
ncbi:Cullin-domain-containing protein [Ascobolus immersus RN42]|uniref:Cullin-domain-containing protein n=1 Tax=Ascobolus immersus RN42 TaxID=1160509 RepID=A0A3N4HLQ2_ASCIM|nr:Cullin-domain-containing protein [Ascobolus immersus RN42]